MLKQLGVCLSLFLIALSLVFSSVQPIFANYAKEFEVYLGDSSSLAEICVVNKNGYALTRGIKGESVQLKTDEFSLERLMSDFDAELRFSEQTSDSKIYYAYSPKIKYKKTVKGTTINLHVVIAEERVVLGSPLIFGSF